MTQASTSEIQARSNVGQQRILVIEDDPATARMVSMALKSGGYLAATARSCREAREALANGTYDLLLCDLYLPDGTGLELLKESQGLPVRIPVVMFTAQGSVETAVEAIREGAFDYLAKPFRIQDLLGLVQKAFDATRNHLEEEAEPPPIAGPPTLLIGRSSAMVDLYKKIALAARSDSPVLITGETGTGKELVAKSLHEFGPRRGRGFVPVNCGALTETLLESELFGHERGSFTGAVATRKGLFEQAQGGTLFLDEITETSPAFQVKLLRALQEGEIRPVGGNRVTKVDVRVVAATNTSIEEYVATAKFRQDLYYRLSVVQLKVPPLRARPDDIQELAIHFLQKISDRLGRRFRLTDGALQSLREYDWPGNVRELENVIERVAVLKTDSTVLAEDFEFLFPNDGPDLPLNELGMVEREKILQVLRDCQGNKTEAARKLGIERKSLYRKARRLGIDLDSLS